MTILKLSTALVHSGHSYTFHLSSGVSISEVAGYIARYEPHLTIDTLEIAHPIQPEQRLQDGDVQPGDRLIAFLQPVRQVELPTPLKPGDKIVRFSLGDRDIDSRGKKGLLVGKSDPAQEIMPDIDLRYFLPPETLDFISRGCLWLSYEEANKVWYASKMGQTRITIDEFELGIEKIALNDAQWLRFYPPIDQPGSSQPLGAIWLSVETIQQYQPTEQIKQGNNRLDISVGAEGEGQTIRVSESLPLDQIFTQLALYSRIPLPQETRFYATRLLSPNDTLSTLRLNHDQFLYASLNPRYGRNTLHLIDVHNRERVFIVSSGAMNDKKVIGCRAEANSPDPSLQIDLHDSLLAQGYVPGERVPQQYLGLIFYQAAENSWWIEAAPQSQPLLFVNNTRVGSHSTVQLTTGDVLSIGPSVAQSFMRLEIDITSRSG